MTINQEEIFGLYRKSDFTDRLNIYLQFQALRDEFLAIEQKEKPPIILETAKSRSKGVHQIVRWLRRRLSFGW